MTEATPESTPRLRGASHVAFTVTDMEASAQWYQRIFGLREIRRFTADEAGTPRILLLDPRTLLAVGLCQPDDADGGRFDYRRTGLDHFALLVDGTDELERWATHLEGCGVAHSPIRDVVGLGRFISFEDPDGIQFELWVNGG